MSNAFPLRAEWLANLNEVAVCYLDTAGAPRMLLLGDWLTFRRRQQQRRAMNRQTKGGPR